MDCIHGLDDTWCSICKAHKQAIKTGEVVFDLSNNEVLANYDGYCNACETPIYAGEIIVHDGTNWIHGECI